MASSELLYERPLIRPLDDSLRRAIEDAYNRRRAEIPVPTEFFWDASLPQFTIKSQWASLIGRFTPERLSVDAELSFMARMLATQAHRGQAVRFLEAIADEIGL